VNTLTAYWAAPTAEDIGGGGERIVSHATDVDELLDAISRFPAEAAIIYHQARPMIQLPGLNGEFPDHEAEVGVRSGWGYLRMSAQDDGDSRWITDGDPTSPAYVQGESAFPAGTGLPVTRVAEALKEFLATARRPTTVNWQPTR
jgi:Immunity protein Imm1